MVEVTREEWTKLAAHVEVLNHEMGAVQRRVEGDLCPKVEGMQEDLTDIKVKIATLSEKVGHMDRTSWFVFTAVVGGMISLALKLWGVL